MLTDSGAVTPNGFAPAVAIVMVKLRAMSNNQIEFVVLTMSVSIIDTGGYRYSTSISHPRFGVAMPNTDALPKLPPYPELFARQAISKEQPREHYRQTRLSPVNSYKFQRQEYPISPA